MTTYEFDMKIDRSVLEEPAPARAIHRAIAPPAAEVIHADDRLIAPLDGQPWSIPSSTEVSSLFCRAARTVAPFVLADVLALVLAGLFAQGFTSWLFPAAAGHVGTMAPVVLLPLVLAYWMSALYSEIWIHPVLEFRQLTQITTLALLAATAGSILLPPLPMWCLAAWPAAVVLVPLLRTVARYFCLNRSWWGYPTLLIASGNDADTLAALLIDASRCGLRPVLATNPVGKCRASLVGAVNDPAALESFIRNENIRHAVISLPQIPVAKMHEIMDHFGRLVPHLLVMTDASTLPTLLGASRGGGRLSGFEVRNSLLNATLQGVKRCIDLGVSLMALAIGLPIMLLIAIFMKLTSRGPVFFGHTRIGRHGKRFKVWKFRTMHVDGKRILEEHLANNPEARAEWDRDQKLRDDPRVTWFGKILRKTSLDELPQLWNVLRGDMSIVGPRPIVESEVARYGEVYWQYVAVKPGITGLWQVSGRNDINYEGRVLLDQFYIRHWSPWLDVYILAKTVVALMNRDGAY